MRNPVGDNTFRVYPVCLVALVIALFAGSPHSSFAQTSVDADVVFVIDTGPTMADEVLVFQSLFNEFFTARIAATGVSLQIVVIGSSSICLPPPTGIDSCPNDENLPLYRHVVTSVGSNDALTKTLSTYDQWTDSLRPGATRTLVVMSDDNSTLSAESFDSRTYLKIVDGTKFHLYKSGHAAPARRPMGSDSGAFS